MARTYFRMNQAKAVGESFSSTKFTSIYTSDLQRAYSTAQAIFERQPAPTPPLVTSELLREQHFGEAEGTSFVKRIFPDVNLSDRSARFPGGESKNDLWERAERVLDEILLPLLDSDTGETSRIAVVSHGLFIKEMIYALIARDLRQHDPITKGLRNTAWARVLVDRKDRGKLLVHLSEFNRHEHLGNVVRQKGGIGSSAHDAKQKSIRDFFGGAKA
ncbi:phosphoglycerate mutase-like protein [Cylindrobasidium torrendii FP15055 ss-10]|uniref:Phosphoglycerate mutase-like protein n=1 Tax=Cylindrobasidium torrendii FP15055 ss-10 TaxID=1314674 RepID=A0A0D7AZW4_9AGAR|nr:phosphoglycerate mutase-like protein [Cylindrobasidium torrendii FP15055 ss-10]